MIYFLIICSLIVISNSQSVEKCYEVQKGWHYTYILPFYGFNNETELFSWIKLDNSSSNYLFADNDEKGHLCTTSWNKLFGTNRCNNYFDNHQDSDRFVWRRNQKCVIFNGVYSIGEKYDCDESGLIELAAYAYDKGEKPFLNQGRLLKEFKTKIKFDKWYGYKLKIFMNKTVYELFDSDKNLIENLVIEHRECNITNYYKGSLSTLYFGGQCPAPKTVSACYKN